MVVKTVLKCFLPKQKPEKSNQSNQETPAEKSDDKPLDKSKDKTSAEEQEGSRSQHQRLQAIELMQSLIKATEKDAKAAKQLASNIGLLTSVIHKVVDTNETWQNKKVKKTGIAVNLFVKAAKILVKGKEKESVVMEGARLIKSLEAAIEKDKTMSNLKGKVKEIQAICKQ